MDTKIRVSMRGVSEQAFGSRCADGLYRDFVTHPAATQATLAITDKQCHVIMLISDVSLNDASVCMEIN